MLKSPVASPRCTLHRSNPPLAIHPTFILAKHQAKHEQLNEEHAKMEEKLKEGGKAALKVHARSSTAARHIRGDFSLHASEKACFTHV